LPRGRGRIALSSSRQVSRPISVCWRAFGHRDVLVCSDELNHASIVDGARLARAEVAVFAHRDTEHLDKLLSSADGRPTIVVTITSSRWTAMSPRYRRSRICAGGSVRCSSSTRRTLSSVLILRRFSKGRRASGRHALQGARFAWRLRRGSAAFRRVAREQGALLHLHDRVAAVLRSGGVGGSRGGAIRRR